MEFPTIRVETTPKESTVPKSLPGTNESSRAEVLASTRQFFATIDHRNINVPTVNQTTVAEVHARDQLELAEVPTTSVVPTTTTSVTPPIVMDETLISSPRVSLLEGSPLHPTVTETCRPRTWMQQLTEGQISKPREEENISGDSSVIEMLSGAIPDELGREWRVLHPFDLLGVRFPTDTTPSNQRCLAKNDALVELIQTTEYLDEVPTWGQRDYRLYPPHYGDPFYRGRGRARGRGGRGRREWLQGRQTERPDRGFAGGNGQTDNIRPQPPTTTDRPTPVRQEDEWSIPPTVGRRNNMERCQIASPSFPVVPPPSEECLFTDWSSEGSPRDRNNQHTQPTRNESARRREPITRQPEEQAIRHNLSEVSTTPTVQVRTDQVGPRRVDRETNTSVVGIRPIDEEARTDLIHTHSIGIQMSSGSSGLSLSTMNEREFIAEPHVPTRIPQLDGPSLVCVIRKPPVPLIRIKLWFLEEIILVGVTVTLMVIEHKEIEDSLEGKDITREEVENPQIDKAWSIQEEEDPLMVEGLLRMEDPLMMEDPQEMVDYQEDLKDRDHQDLPDLLDPYDQ